MAYIRHLLHGSPIAHYPLEERLTIGRSPDNDLAIDDATVSGHHAVIERAGEGYCIRDLGSTNGVLINGERREESDITEGDAILIGTQDLQLVYTLPDELKSTLKIKKSWIPGVYYTK